MTTATKRATLKIGDEINILSFEGFGGIARVVGKRNCRTSHYKVELIDGSQPGPFWAHDFEIEELDDNAANANHVDSVDSRPDTYKHIQTVQRFLGKMIRHLLGRSEEHDQSKLVSPEVETFDEVTPRLAASTYGSDEYKSFLADMTPALDHHYANNSHHPEHYENGIKGMTLLDLVEMLCDWKAATLRHNDGCIRKSIEINQKRFGYSDDLKQIFLNTLAEIED